MKVLAVVPDGNIMDRVRWLAKWNSEIEWDVIGIGSDCAWEPVDWVSSFKCLDVDYREVKSYPQDVDYNNDMGLCGTRDFSYELACQELRSPLLGYWFHFDKYEMLRGRADLDNTIRPRSDYDMLLTWGERGWYNETAIGIAKNSGKPVCRLERATFPGMFVADGTGLEQGRCDLAGLHYRIHDQSCRNWMRRGKQLCDWLSVAPWQAIESQPRTTLGMAAKYLDDRPSVFVPLQVPVDTNMVFRSNVDNWGLLEYVGVNFPNHNVLVKKHPGDQFTSDEALQSHCDERGFQLVTGASHAFLQVVDEVASINSQVIIEAWMHGLSPTILGQPAFDLPEETDKQSLLYTLRFAYFIEPWQLTDRLAWIRSRND